MLDYNDSDRELIEFQQNAQRLGVDQLRIYFTFTEHYIKRRPDDFPRNFPNIDFYDLAGKFNFSAEELANMNANCVHSNLAASHIGLINAICHWLELGIAGRDEFESLSGFSFAHPSWYTTRYGHPDLEQFKLAPRSSFHALAGIYGNRGQQEEATRFEAYAGQVS
jgi:hypothetical protein